MSTRSLVRAALAAAATVAVLATPAGAAAERICVSSTDHEWCVPTARDILERLKTPNTDCRVDVGSCEGDCVVNVGYCAPGGDCVVNVGYCDDNDLPIGV